MLKIKDNIDLKELEKFGFYVLVDGWHIIQNSINLYIDDGNIICFSIFGDEKTNWFDLPSVIYDLIKADMVEKVVE